MKRGLALIFMAFLAACGTPQEQCISRETRELRDLDRLIVETEENIERGYAIEEFRTVEYVETTCGSRPHRNPDGSIDYDYVTCVRPEFDIDYRLRPINEDDERARLGSMRNRRGELARRTEATVAQCRELYPE